MARAATQPFDWGQFRVMLRVIRKGEQRLDETGMGLGGDAGAGATGDGAARRVGMGLRRAAMALLVAMLVVAFFMMGVGLGRAGVTPYAALSLCVLCLVGLTVLTGVYQAVNVLYFVRDLGYYLTLPVSATTVMWAKLAHFLGMTVLGDLVLLPVALGCLFETGAPAACWAAVAVAFVLCALATNLALVIVCVPVLRFSRLARDKDRFSRLFGAVAVVLALGLGLASQFAMRGDGLASLAHGADELLSGGPAAVAVGVLCPPSLLVRVVVGTGPAAALTGLAGMAALVAAYALLLHVVAGRWYLEGVQALQGAGGRRGRVVAGEALARATRPRGALAANLARDWAAMSRVPVFFNQFVLGSALMPLYFVAIAVVSGAVGVSQAGEAGVGAADLLSMARSMASGLAADGLALCWCAVGVLAFAVLMGFSSYVFTLAVSRDGEDFFFMRALPMDWRAYLASKVVAPLALSTGPVLALLVAALVVLAAPVTAALVLVGVYAGASLALALLSLGLGALFPRLSWDNEAQLVKGGAATVVTLAGVVLGLVVAALPALVLLGCGLWGLWGAPVALALAMSLLAAECAGLAWWVLGPVARRLSRLER